MVPLNEGKPRWDFARGIRPENPPGTCPQRGRSGEADGPHGAFLRGKKV
jgi:hypothetical protein